MTTRPDPQFPRQVNFQVTDRQGDRLDYVAQQAGKSRAAILRECIDAAIEGVAERNKVRGVMRVGASVRRRGTQ